MLNQAFPKIFFLIYAYFRVALKISSIKTSHLTWNLQLSELHGHTTAAVIIRRTDSRGHLVHPMVQNRVIYHCIHHASCSLTCSSDVRHFLGKKEKKTHITDLLKSSLLNLQSITFPHLSYEQIILSFSEFVHQLL